MRLDHDSALRLLAESDHGVLSTVHPDRGVDAVPAVYVIDDGYVGVPVDRVKPKASTRLQRERNLEADPRASGHVRARSGITALVADVSATPAGGNVPSPRGAPDAAPARLPYPRFSVTTLDAFVPSGRAIETAGMPACASGKWSARKPPPFFLEKKPLKPQRLSGSAPMSSRSTTSRSPGSAPFTPTGPER